MATELLLRYFSMILLFVILYKVYSLLYLFVNFLWDRRMIGQAVNQFPMDEKHWLKGHAHKIQGQGEQGLSYFRELVHKYPKACGLYLINFLKPYVVVHHPDTVKVVLKGIGGKTVLLGMYSYARRWLGDGLVLSTGKKWLRNRRLLTPTFHFEALKHYIKVDNEASDIFLDKLLKFAKCNEPLEICRMAANLTFDVILRCAVSYESEAQTLGKVHFYIEAVEKLMRLTMKRQFQPWAHFDFIYWKTSDGKAFLKYCNTVDDFTNKIIKERRELLQENLNKADTYHDFLDTLLRSKDEDGTGLTDKEIKDEMNTFIAAGYETTASAISWCLYNLASNPIHQKMCQEEVDKIMKGRSDEYLTWNDLQNIPYLTMCLKESMRLYGFPFIERELDEDVMIDGKLVPAGTSVMINLHNLHHNPKIWDNPSKFDPERFSKERSEPLDSFAFIPFSAGSRNCIGQAFAMEELKIVLARTLRRFTLTVAENFEPIESMEGTLKSSNGIYLKASERTL